MEAAQAKRIAAAWALGRSDEVEKDWAPIWDWARRCDLCMELRFRMKLASGDETEARDAGIELLALKGSIKNWKLPQSLDLFDAVLDLLRKHGLPKE